MITWDDLAKQFDQKSGRANEKEEDCKNYIRYGLQGELNELLPFEIEFNNNFAIFEIPKDKYFNCITNYTPDSFVKLFDCLFIHYYRINHNMLIFKVPVDVYNYLIKILVIMTGASGDIDEEYDFNFMRNMNINIFNYNKNYYPLIKKRIKELESEITYGTRGKFYKEFNELYNTIYIRHLKINLILEE